MSSIRHHYVPRFYLKGFTETAGSEFLWVYQKGKQKAWRAPVKDVGVKKNYHTFKTTDGQADHDSFEKVLSTVEGKAAAVFRQLVARKLLSPDDRLALANFLAFAMVRSPRFREGAANLQGEMHKKILQLMASHEQGFQATYQRYQEVRGPQDNVSAHELRDILLKGNYDMKVDPSSTLTLFTLAEKFAPVIIAMRWLILTATGQKRFITCDSPLFLDVPPKPAGKSESFPREVGLMSEDVELTFPINQDMVLLATWTDGPDAFVQVGDIAVEQVNYRTILAAARHVYAPLHSPELERTVQSMEENVRPYYVL